MKKLFYLIVLISQGVFAQEKISLDTIYVNEFHNVSLFFPSPVRQGIVGAPNFTFSFNEDHPQHFGLLKGTPGSESSLLVLTTDGQIYSYFLKYLAALPELNYFIPETESIGNEVPKIVVERPTEEVEDTVDVKISRDSINRINSYDKLSKYYLQNSTGNLKTKKKDKLRLTLKNMIYYGNETYMVLELQNKSTIDFELNYLNVYLTRGDRKRNASFQKVLKRPLHTYGLPEVVRKNQNRTFVYILPKFTIGENERLEVEVREKRGNRHLKLRFKD